MNKHSSKEIKAVEKLNEDLAKVRSHVKEIIFGQDEVVDKRQHLIQTISIINNPFICKF